MADTQKIDFGLGGMHAGGAPNLIPETATRLMQNMVRRPGPVWEKRSPFTDTAIVSGSAQALGIGIWEDQTNGVRRTIVVRWNNAGGTHDLVLSPTSGAAVPFANPDPINIVESTYGLLTSYVTHKGVWYYALTDNFGGSFTGAPSVIHSFNGSSTNTNALGGETIAARCLTSFIGRIFLGYAKATITNQLGTSVAYDPTTWSQVTTTRELITNGSTITGRITPTATTNSQIYEIDVYTVAASTSQQALVLSCGIKGVSPTYAMPVTLEIYYSQVWVANTAYAAGAIRVPTTPATGNGFRYRCTVAGTSDAVTEPTWPTTVGTTVTDGTATWVCDGPDAVASAPITIPSATDSTTPTSVSVRATFPPNPASSKVGVRLKFGTTATPTITLAPLDISYRDGLDDADPRKANWGAQLTVGQFAHRFFNAEDSASSTASYENYVFWTDPFDPDTIRADYYYRLDEAPGPITAMWVQSKRLIVCKRFGIWIFAPTEDADNPIQLEAFIANYGCKGPTAWALYAGASYFIGNPDEVYRFEVGGEPTPLANDAMRNRLFYTSDSALFDNSDSKMLQWRVAVDEENRDLIVTTRASENGVLDLDSGAWSTLVVGSEAIQGQVWNATANALYAWTGIANVGSECYYLSTDTASATDPSSTAIVAYVEFRPISASFRHERPTLNQFRWLNQTSGTQSGNTSKLEITRDGGANWDRSITFTMPTVSASDRDEWVALASLSQTSHRLGVRLYHSGKGGGEMFRVAAAEAMITPGATDATSITQPTVSASTLT